MKELCWVEISKSALTHNIKQFRGIIGSNILLCSCIKANAYGHGLLSTAKIFLEAGADWLCVNALYEAKILRSAGILCPLYIMGYVPINQIHDAASLNCRIIVYNLETIEELGKITKHSNIPVRIHIKVETGTNRQGIPVSMLPRFIQDVNKFNNISIEGLATHFANIEDTTDPSYAELQLQHFINADNELRALGTNITIKHCANSAATILFPETHFQMVRTGISCYGMWPSNETKVSYRQGKSNDLTLIPAFTWKTRIAQIKNIGTGEHIGYGCTFKTTHPTTLAILPVGYYDGYDRGITEGYVLIRGKRAPIRGRICMNIIMVEITDIPEALIEDEVVLIGKSGQEMISAEQFAAWAGTINYEVTTRVNERIPRVVVD